VDLVHFSIGHFIYSGTIKCGLSPLFHWCLHMTRPICWLCPADGNTARTNDAV